VLDGFIVPEHAQWWANWVNATLTACPHDLPKAVQLQAGVSPTVSIPSAPGVYKLCAHDGEGWALQQPTLQIGLKPCHPIILGNMHDYLLDVIA
jgi:hypothetical protein